MQRIFNFKARAGCQKSISGRTHVVQRAIAREAVLKLHLRLHDLAQRHASTARAREEGGRVIAQIVHIAVTKYIAQIVYFAVTKYGTRWTCVACIVAYTTTSRSSDPLC